MTGFVVQGQHMCIVFIKVLIYTSFQKFGGHSVSFWEKLIKSDSKDYHCYKKILYKIKLFFWIFYSSKNPGGGGGLKDHVTQKAAENSALPSQELITFNVF